MPAQFWLVLVAFGALAFILTLSRLLTVQAYSMEIPWTSLCEEDLVVTDLGSAKADRTMQRFYRLWNSGTLLIYRRVTEGSKLTEHLTIKVHGYLFDPVLEFESGRFVEWTFAPGQEVPQLTPKDREMAVRILERVRGAVMASRSEAVLFQVG